MASPVDSARQGTNFTTATTTFAINVGSPVDGTFLVVFVRFGGAPGTVTFTGYTQLGSSTADATDDQTMVFYRWADGTEGATDDLTTVNSVKGCAISWEVTGAAYPGTLIAHPDISTATTGTTSANSANPGNLGLFKAADMLYLALMGLDGITNAPTVGPSSFSNLTTANSGTGSTAATNCSIGGASRQVAASGSQDPAVFTHAAATTGWTAWTVGIFPPDAHIYIPVGFMTGRAY